MKRFYPAKIVIISLLMVHSIALSQTKLAIHGYLTQAYAFTNTHQLMGIPHDGTSDYRNLALQFRYSITSHDNLVFQFSHKRLGRSPFMLIEEAVALDWAFFEHRFSFGTSMKVGKVQLPMGIFNELRDVGVLLPFYRAPFNLYQEGRYTSETVDGFVLTHLLGEYSSWGVDVDFYGGEWKWSEATKSIFTKTDMVQTIDVTHGLGGQLWLRCPIDGFRLGLAGNKAHSAKGYHFDELDFYSLMYSLDSDFTIFSTRAEFRDARFDNKVNYQAYYAQVGLKLFEKLRINIQADFADIKNMDQLEIPFVEDVKKSMNLHDDYAFGINFAFNPNIILKTEAHWTKGIYIEDELINYFTADPIEVRYYIFSLATSPGSVKSFMKKFRLKFAHIALSSPSEWVKKGKIARFRGRLRGER
ncbi:hypothetical protein JXJ21_19885 [candidate division KSB1 bacterium]|nr:hypothetical protein [candidate division KSB1 bacterium]